MKKILLPEQKAEVTLFEVDEATKERNNTVKRDCFAYRTKKARNGRIVEKCNAVNELECDVCKFYKPKGTECDTCSYKGKRQCKHCHDK